LNFKGGTGKTSVSTSYAFRLAEMGHRVLVIDLDSQGHASKCLGVQGEEAEKTLFDAIIKKTPLSSVILKTGMPGLDLVPSNLTMSTIDLSLMPACRARVPAAQRAQGGGGHGTTNAVLDAPPSFGLLNLNALMAAHDLFRARAPRLPLLPRAQAPLRDVQGLEEDLEHVLDHIFIVINAYNATYKDREGSEGSADQALPGVLAQAGDPAVHKFRASFQRRNSHLRL